MNTTLKRLEKLFTPEVFSTFITKNFTKGSIVLSYSDKNSFVVIKGRVNAVRYYENREYLAPYTFMPGDIAGFYRNYTIKKANWDFRAESDVQVLVIPEDIIRNKVFNNLELYKFFNEVSATTWNKVIQIFYLQIHGKTKAAFAFYLLEYSEDGIFNFVKVENIAKAINISRTRLFNIEKEFVEKGLIKKVKKSYEILKAEELRKYYIDYL